MTDAQRRRNESGITLIEMVVSVSILAIFLTMFSGALVMMYRTSNNVNATAETSTQVNNAFARLDSMIRYASAIGDVRTLAGDPAVAWQTTATGEVHCAQLRLSHAKQQLQLRTWTVADSGSPTDQKSWLPLASSVDNVDPDSGAEFSPFVVPNITAPSDPDADVTTSQQLLVRLTAVSPSGETNQASTLAVTFTALNSDANVETPAICNQLDGTP